MSSRRFMQCDVFTAIPTKGNGLAVVVDGDGLSDETMQAFAAWTNLAETTFLMAPTTPEADYKVRIFTPAREMLFAGHPTLGSCASWLRSDGKPKKMGVVMQECGVGIVAIDVSGEVPAFAAPKTIVKSLAADKLQSIRSALGIDPDRIVRTKSAADVLAADSSKIRFPEFLGVGLIGAHSEGSACQFETRMLGTSSGSEDPITGSLNAAIACWMYGAGYWSGPMIVAQGTCIGRQGRVHIRRDDATGTVWVGGQTCVLIEGTLSL